MKFLLEIVGPEPQNNTPKQELNPDTPEKIVDPGDLKPKEEKPKKVTTSTQSLLDAKNIVSAQKNIDYDDLEGIDRDKFVRDCLNYMDNASVLNQAKESISTHIVDGDWKAKEFLTYLEKLPKNIQIDNDLVDLVYQLQKTGKIKGNPDWLSNESLYKRPYDQRLYTIKALTFADNPQLQQNQDGVNKYFDDDNPLTIKDLIKDGEILSSTKIETIMNNKQTKEAEPAGKGRSFRAQTVSKAQDSAEKQAITQEYEKADKTVLDSAVIILRNLKTPNAEQLAREQFTPGDSIDELVKKCLQNFGS